MMGISLFGTCTMKYNPRLNEDLAARPCDRRSASAPGRGDAAGRARSRPRIRSHPARAVGHGSVRLPARLAAPTPPTRTPASRAPITPRRASWVSATRSSPRIQAHPCNRGDGGRSRLQGRHVAARGATAIPRCDASRPRSRTRTAALMVNNPDDMGIYNPEIKDWVRIVHEAGGLCFYDHANFNGVMSKLRARELGFDACMFMLHKTFGAPRAAAARRSAPTAAATSSHRSCPAPSSPSTAERYGAQRQPPKSIGRVREYWGNVPQVVKAYAWARAMGADGIAEASDISVLANNYMEKRAPEDPRRHAVASEARRLAHRDDALQPRAALRTRPA